MHSTVKVGIRNECIMVRICKTMQCILPLGLGLKLKMIVRVCKHCECILRLGLHGLNIKIIVRVCKTMYGDAMHSTVRFGVKNENNS